MKSVNEKKGGDEKSYRTLCAALARSRRGVTVADAASSTALPLAVIKELLPRAADEFSARLAVTESGEIVYSFPRGFTSRYRGFGARLARFADKFRAGLAAAASLLFKIWIMIMLIGYFVLFIAIALASIVLSVAAQSKNSNGRRRTNVSFGPGIFNLIWRLWFYSELTRSAERAYGRTDGRREKPRPLHKAIFSFVFGDEDPNRSLREREKKALIAYIQAHSGVISLPEFMTVTGKTHLEADTALMAFCAEFGGSPEASGDGTIVYRFDELLLRANRQDFSAGEKAPLFSALKKFSVNTGGMNTGFVLINAVNLIFGSYFFFSAVTANANSRIFALTFYYLNMVVQNPLPLIAVALGIVPLVFSLLFWLVPALRYALMKKDNETFKMENLRRLGFARIWSAPFAVKSSDIDGEGAESRPRNMARARERVITDMAVYSVPEIAVNEKSETVYSFAELEREKLALEKYRARVADKDSELGRFVFDSDA